MTDLINCHGPTFKGAYEKYRSTGWADECCSGAVATGSIFVFLAVSVILLLLYVGLFHLICFLRALL